MTNTEGTNSSANRLERYRAYLRVLARSQMDGVLRRKHEPSDMVQLTLMQAYRAMPGFQGTTEAELAAWLRRILARNLAHAYRDLRRQKRDAGLERSLEGAMERSSACMGGMLAAQDTSPSMKVVRTEQLLRIAAAVEQLPEAQREAMVMHYWQEIPLSEVAKGLGRSPSAAAGLIHRALKAIRRQLSEP